MKSSKLSAIRNKDSLHAAVIMTPCIAILSALGLGLANEYIDDRSEGAQIIADAKSDAMDIITKADDHPAIDNAQQFNRQYAASASSVYVERNNNESDQSNLMGRTDAALYIAGLAISKIDPDIIGLYPFKVVQSNYDCLTYSPYDSSGIAVSELRSDSFTVPSNSPNSPDLDFKITPEGPVIADTAETLQVLHDFDCTTSTIGYEVELVRLP